MTLRSTRLQSCWLLPVIASGVLVGCAGSAASEPATPAAAESSSESAAAPSSASEAAPARPAAAEPAAPTSTTAVVNPPATVSEPPPPAPPPRCPEGMALVSGGEFQRAGTATPKPIPDLCVDLTETTTRQYGECVTAGACTTSGVECSAQTTYNRPGKEDFPMVCLVFEQAKAYCAHRGKRLPSVDEWEWFARSGDEARTYSWGNEPPDEQLCWTGKKRQSESCPVGSHPGDVSRDGILDLTGNVLEFTSTDADEHSPIRIARGGAWNGGDAALFKNSRLGGFKSDYRCGFLGVRCVVEAAPIAPGSSTPAR